MIILYTYKFSLHERGFIRFYGNHPSITNKILEVTKICIIIYERGKENEHRVSINKTEIKKLTLHQEILYGYLILKPSTLIFIYNRGLIVSACMYLAMCH